MEIRVNKRIIEITNADKIWFPEFGYTKLDIVRYYQEIAPKMIPYVQKRALVMHRYPDGITGEHFFHKNMPDYFPEWINAIDVVNRGGGHTRYVVCDDAETLVYLASQACITPHIWLSTVKALEYPDKLIFDLDPPTDHDFALVKKVAKVLRALLEEVKVESQVMTTGSRGLHVIVPLKEKYDFDTVREQAKMVAQMVIEQMPEKVTLEARKEKRDNKLLIDIMRNGYGQTSVAPYAVRARPHAPVATPLEWDELDNSRLRSDLYTIKTIFKRL